MKERWANLKAQGKNTVALSGIHPLKGKISKQIGRIRTDETRMKMSESKKKFLQTENGKALHLANTQKAIQSNIGAIFTEERRKKIRLSKLGKARPDMAGSNNPKWISDRSLLKDDHRDRGGQLHREWSKDVKNRDGWKCKISNGDCSGRLEAHHIFGWKSHPELRYEINNGITLCHFHHPRKREEETRLSPYFQTLVKEAH